ncbi:MAG: NAD(P)/FAD-dependent oxidoreductase [Burkholderiaceae bacterium]
MNQSESPADASVDAVVIGAGVVGLAVARALAMSGLEVIILEAANAIGTETSSRHSEVIHAGIYYRANSLKAELCLRGKHLLYEYCDQHGVAYRRCGKLIVATDQVQLATLESLAERAQTNGVEQMQMVSVRQVAELEPELFCTGALHSGSTGIIDSHGFMLSLLGEAESHGASLALLSRVVGLSSDRDGVRLSVATDGARDPDFSLQASLVVNCAGHQAPALARSVPAPAANLPAAAPLAKGNYFRFAGKAPCSRLIYPVPEPGGLGVHLTLDLGGQARFGPDVEWVDSFDYAVEPRRAEGFYQAIRRYWPGLPDGALVPDYAGIRPKVVVNDEIHDDFVIHSDATDKRAHRMIHLLGIESPGLTSSLAIAERVAAMV